ncbi:HAMP domain-containing sensor histidine kinase [Clostridium sp. ATCC 25772]|uniref:sensor histidine kinase n=1 Tax=Clostridium sp. ATCC 25772 TaxID=1676991 RepID=UPI000782ED13|nr:HAMP domain-containing sensor histidine kinase [Clostridium sp. ATCC 25772]
MKSVKVLLLDNLYKVFIMIILIISGVFLLGAKYKFKNALKVNIDLNELLNYIFIMNSIFIFIIFILITGFVYLLRSKVLNFSNRMSDIIDKIICNEENIVFDTDKETLLSKLENKLKKLVDIIETDRKKYFMERDSIKSLISDISHQIKTPIANICMYNDTLIERELDENNEKLFLSNMRNQVSKLQWLVQALIKMSRLESNIIALNNKNTFLMDTIAISLKGIYLKAENKDIKLTVSCPQKLKLCHDKKWTSEAIFNIIENAVKYTENGGEIQIIVDEWQLFTKIDITDTGIGIENQDINNIFKRFYRGKEVTEFEGVGIGLYLANEIITKQGGYIKVNSKKGKGSTFSIFLKN